MEITYKMYLDYLKTRYNLPTSQTSIVLYSYFIVIIYTSCNNINQ